MLWQTLEPQTIQIVVGERYILPPREEQNCLAGVIRILCESWKINEEVKRLFENTDPGEFNYVRYVRGSKENQYFSNLDSVSKYLLQLQNRFFKHPLRVSALVD
jgi:hypothetical protein